VSQPRRIPPVWILALPGLTFGMAVGFVIVTLPQMLAEQGLSGSRIPVAVALISSPSFFSFLLAPLLDVRFRRRTYATVFGVLAAAAISWVVLDHHSAAEVEAVMFVGFLSLMLFTSAQAGWAGSLIVRAQASSLGAWGTAYNIAGSGAGILLSGYASERFAPATAAACLFPLLLAPLLVFPLIPAPAPDATLARESFSRFIREVAALFRRSEVLVALALFLLPSGSFALTNVLGGWGQDFHAAAALVSFLGGMGAMLAGIIGCSLMPVLARKLPLRPLYLSIGLLGAAFTVSLLFLPHVPGTYGLAFIGENVFQSAAIATAMAIIFEVIGPGNPLAATIFALLGASGNLPIFYMELIDGRAFHWRGVEGAFLCDAAVTGAACLVLAIVLRRRLFAGAAARELAVTSGQ
jgi:PAT family beta-lactamase induction signal transducer AmpG